jgi:hypothetical protein
MSMKLAAVFPTTLTRFGAFLTSIAGFARARATASLARGIAQMTMA